MKAIPWNRLLPVFAAIALFYGLALTYFSPVLDGQQLIQGDKRNWQGMAQEVQEHRELHGTEPLWTGSMFSGMPAYQISVLWPSNLLLKAHGLFTGFLPRPASFLFLYLLGMFVLLQCLRVDSWLSLVGAVAFGFSSYFFIILEAGHNSKANAIGYMPMVLGAFHLLYRGRALLGASLFGLFMGLEVAMNHVQVTYYLGIVLVLYALAELVRAARGGAVADFVKRSGMGLLGLAFALACNIGLLWTTYEYSRHTTRGASELTIKADGSKADDIRTTGLDRDYVTDWSYGLDESLTLLVPDAKGGATGAIGNDPDVLAAADARLRQNLAGMNRYFGDQRFTSGPVYLGAIVVLLLLLALAQADRRALYWVLAALPVTAVMLAISSPAAAGALVFLYLLAGLVFWRDTLAYALFAALLLTLFLAWGRNYMPLTDFFLDHVPGYNKFRAVTIILVVVELAAPVLGILYLDKLLRNGGWERAQEKRFLVPAGILVLLLAVFAASPGSFVDLLSQAERESFNAQADSSPQMEAQVVAFVQELKAVRAGIVQADALRSLMFVVVAAVLIFLFGRKVIGRAVLLPALGLLILFDMWGVDRRYLHNEKERGRYVKWEDATQTERPFQPTAADKAILEQEITPAVLADHEEAMARMRKAREHASGRARTISPEDELLARFGSLRRQSHYRVLTLSNPFNDSRVSYFHKSVGGYHGAKLKRYQELIEFHLGREINAVIGAFGEGATIASIDSVLAAQRVMNMLNTRYLIYDAGRPPLRNLNANGPGWFVEELRWVPDADAEITTLGTIDPQVTALVDERYRDVLGDARAVADPSATVELESYRADRISYKVRSGQGGVVVFSEIWYGPDWHADIDGTPAAHVRADYVLRAMAVPAGEHTVTFTLRSRAYDVSRPVAIAGSLVLMLLVLAALGMEVRSVLRGS